MTKTQNSVKTRSQFFTHLNNQAKITKRQNLGQAVALPKFKPVISASWASLLPSPEFEIGDKVADLWRDEFGKKCREIGMVVGICWHPQNFQWEYLINWIDGDSDKSVYPCFDGQLIVGIVNVNYKPSKLD